jgi:leader peptidase (prepilin peptidase)/N-methyltransferase
MHYLLYDIPAVGTALLFFTVGAGVGHLIVLWIDQLTDNPDNSASLSQRRVPQASWWRHVPLVGTLLPRRSEEGTSEPMDGWCLLIELTTALLFAGFVMAVTRLDCQHTPEVAPSEAWRTVRIVYHLILISLLVAATGTDLREYTIPDSITLTGGAIGLVGATLSGQLQMVHIWVDWNQEIPGFRGPYFPDWLHPHQHLHGLAWSAAGLVAGAGLCWLVRVVSRLLLGRVALGFGDVMLMGMIGSFVGWQAVTLIFLLAPLCAIVLGLIVRLTAGGTFLPYGPFLSVATVIVLFTWNWLWLATRDTFGDVPSLAKLGGIAIGSLITLLALIRLYRMIPVARTAAAEESENQPPADESDT